MLVSILYILQNQLQYMHETHKYDMNHNTKLDHHINISKSNINIKQDRSYN